MNQHEYAQQKAIQDLKAKGLRIPGGAEPAQPADPEGREALVKELIATLRTEVYGKPTDAERRAHEALIRRAQQLIGQG